MTDAIRMTGVRKTFGTKVAVDNLDLALPAGGLYGLIGPNGAGKTTTIRMVMSILFADSGTVSVLGRASAIESKDRIGYLPEERGLYRKMRVLALLTYMARLKGVDAPAAAKRAREWLVRLDLAKEARKKCEELSKGMQQKVQFASSVIHQPDLLILDEVFTGLDPVNRRLIRGLIREQHQRGCTVIFSTHAMVEAEQLCDRIVMIHRGHKVLDATMDEIRARFDPRTVMVEPADPGGAAALAEVPGIQSVSSSDENTSVLEARLAAGLDPQEGIRRIAAAIPVRRMEVKRVTLEDVFIDLVGASGGDAPSRADIRGEHAEAAHA
ncbi:MAG: ATP-binding cassette domain-containing protein [Phycisphaerales bacterium]|nr:ATP-binding cassette domain-containing protein [Phycisphaerales bacterium]